MEQDKSETIPYWIFERLLAQNDRLIEALTQSSPVEIVRALNPTPVISPQPADIWSQDTPPRPLPEDPWGDPDIPIDHINPRIGTDPWVDPPFKEIAHGETAQTE